MNIPPDNFRGSTGFNVNSFAVPGLMPTTTPILDSRVKTSPDGSILLPLFSIAEGEQNPFPFPVAISSLDKKILLYDVAGDHIFHTTTCEGRTCFYFLVDGASEALPVGQVYLDVLVEGINKRYIIIVPDSPFAIGKKTGYRLPDNEKPLRFVVKGEIAIDVGSESIFVPYEFPFISAPSSVVAKAYTASGTPVPMLLTSFTNAGMYVTFDEETTVPVTLEYISWSLNSPLYISGLGRSLGVFRVDDSIVLG